MKLNSFAYESLASQNKTEVAMFPSQASKQKFIETIKVCSKSMDICVYHLTDESVFQILVGHHNRGVKVRIITDCDIKKYAQLGTLLYGKLIVKAPPKNKKGALMHNKFVIIDSKLMITGSMNLTKMGLNENYENQVYVHE